MPLLLTVIYHKPTGKILRKPETINITHRKQILKYVTGYPLNELAFYHEQLYAPIDIDLDSIKTIVYGTAPVLCGPDGNPKVFPIHIATQWAEISAAHSLKIDFEGGMGDQILQLQALKQLQLALPDLPIEIGLRPNYYAVAQFLEHNAPYTHTGKPSPRMGYHYYVNQHTNFISDPRGGLYGKASLYGANLGLHRVDQFISLHIPYAHALAAALEGGVDIEKIRFPLLGVHIRSGSGGAKSWNHEHAIALADRWHEATGGTTYLIGNPKDYGRQHPHTLTTPYTSDWLTPASLITRLSAMVAIDSGPMHLALAASIPTIILWGGTGPTNILGRRPISTDLIPALPCIDNVCYACPHGNALCMKAIKPSHVWDLLSTNFPGICHQPPAAASLLPPQEGNQSAKT